MNKSTHFFSIANKSEVFRASLLAFFIGLPITNGSWSLIGYFHSFVFLFTLSNLLLFRKELPSLLSQLKTKHTTAFYLLISWCALVTLSLINTLLQDITPFHIFAASQRYIHDAITLLFTFCLARLLLLNSITLQQIITALCLGMFFMMTLHYYTYQLDLISGHQWFRTPPLAPHMRDLGNLACVCIVGCFSLLCNQKEQPTLLRQFYLFSFLANWAFLVWTGGRMGVAASTITCLLLGIYFFKFQGRNVKILITLALAAFTGGYTGNQLSVFEWNGISRTAEFTEQAQNIATANTNNTVEEDIFTKANALSTGRAYMWQLSLNAMMQSPWLGLGPFGYFFIPERFYDDQPHNFIVQFLVEWGILGSIPIFALLLLMAFYTLKKLPHEIRNMNNNFITGTAIVFVLSIHGLTGGTYFKIQPFICLATGFAALIASALKPNKVD